ncbi:Uncharacterized membrane protein [Catalinimonas alkaloidigena]|uniref:Uncharacterized membrane protein n=1 Tax=Catalinimonas alkaloidigena TaxID=1075417 RepID=A0A1G9N7P2_9BACT|nr:DUF819 family protein [Catalinimonas alkaloidigena]SDL82549.1 Uncharacterized membrane protein [Catalinimonas alkaloidigena]
MDASEPLITNDAVVLGLLLGILAAIFWTSRQPAFQAFYRYVPALLLCYFVPAIFNSLGVISAARSDLDGVAARYLLPASLVLLTLSIDLKGIVRLGPKAVVMFLAGTLGIVVGGPIAILLVSIFDPDLVGGSGPDAVWRGLATIAGSWIGGSANQVAMKGTFEPSAALFSAMLVVDVLVANVWMAFLLYGAGISDRVDRWFRADSSAIVDVQRRVENYQASIARIPQLADLILIVAAGFGVTGLAHLLAGSIAPWIAIHAPALEQFSLTSQTFWIVVIATTGGLLLSLTPARQLEGVGASKVGSVLLYVLIATIGMQMDVLAIFNNLGYFAIGLVWMAVHVTVLLLVGWLIRAPFFFTAVGSQANVGGAASAPVVASAFHPALAPVGVMLAVLGYALGTYAAYLCGLLMELASGG